MNNFDERIRAHYPACPVENQADLDWCTWHQTHVGSILTDRPSPLGHAGCTCVDLCEKNFKCMAWKERAVKAEASNERYRVKCEDLIDRFGKTELGLSKAFAEAIEAERLKGSNEIANLQRQLVAVKQSKSGLSRSLDEQRGLTTQLCTRLESVERKLKVEQQTTAMKIDCYVEERDAWKRRAELAETDVNKLTMERESVKQEREKIAAEQRRDRSQTPYMAGYDQARIDLVRELGWKADRADNLLVHLLEMQTAAKEIETKRSDSEASNVAFEPKFRLGQTVCSISLGHVGQVVHLQFDPFLGWEYGVSGNLWARQDSLRPVSKFAIGEQVTGKTSVEELNGVIVRKEWGLFDWIYTVENFHRIVELTESLITAETPLHIHDCIQCIFLGRYNDTFDLYWCQNSRNALSRLGQCIDSISSQTDAYSVTEALRRAKDRGLT